ncbi:MAG: hypothetical protein Q9170_005613 [Blastenia crenularia]
MGPRNKRDLLAALNSHPRLISLYLWVYPRLSLENKFLERLKNTTKEISIVAGGNTNPERRPWIQPKTTFWKTILAGYPSPDRLRQRKLLNVEGRYASDLKVLEIVYPNPNDADYDYQVLRERKLAQPLSHFRNLVVLYLQKFKAPVCEVLYHVVEAGKHLKSLQLHDHEVSGIDRWYEFRRDQSPLEILNCYFHKFLLYSCPGVEFLSVDITANGLGENKAICQKKVLEPQDDTLEQLLKILEQVETRKVKQTFAPFQHLRSLKLVIPFAPIVQDEERVLAISKGMWSANLEQLVLSRVSTGSLYTLLSYIDIEADRQGKSERCVTCPDAY